MASEDTSISNVADFKNIKDKLERLSILADSGISITIRKIMHRLKIDEKNAIRILRDELIRADSKAELS